MALGRFLAFLLLAYVGIAVAVIVAVVAALAFSICVFGMGEWAMAPYWEIISERLHH
jgi:hypothetical protein